MGILKLGITDRLIWDLDFPDHVSWDEEVGPYLKIFLILHKGRQNEDDFDKFIDELAS